jgi:ABC-type sulfate/molybdate transport systems ATPase subunit
VSVREQLREVLQGFAGVCVMVSHEPQDAASLASRVVVIEDGRVTQDASPQALAASPATSYIEALMRATA